MRSCSPAPRRPIAAALLVLSAGAAMLATARPAAAQDGVTFTYRVTSTAARGAPQGANMVATVRAAGPNMRLDFREGGLPMTKPGGYVLIRGADRTFVIVNPEDRSALVIDGASLGMGAGAATNNALVKVAQTQSRFDFEDLGAGERILGYATRRVRFTAGGTTEVRVLGKTNRSSDETTGEAWVATRLPGVDAEALRQWGMAFGRGMQRTNADLAPRMADYDRQYGNGLALRTVLVSTRTDDKGRAATDTMRMEITELSSGRIDPALLAIPAGYQVADMREMAAAADSARRAGGADTAAAEKPSLKRALGGFLKKKP